MTKSFNDIGLDLPVFYSTVKSFLQLFLDHFVIKYMFYLFLYIIKIK